jgi:NAD(P)-dependent dehydrogenase (short-subunit alcohol dehydrogenase family)
MRVVLVGGNKGLGEAIKQVLKLNEHKYEYRLVNRPTCSRFDLRGPEEQISLTIRDAITDMGGCDALIVSAGSGAYHKPTVSQDVVEELMLVNFIGPTTCFRAAQKALLKSKGKAIFVSSTVARRPGSGGLSYYAATKGAMNSWVQSEGRRQAKHGVALCAVSPGFFDSPMTDEINCKVRAVSEKAIPYGRFGTCDEIAEFIVGLLYQSNWCLAGSIYELSGGA